MNDYDPFNEIEKRMTRFDKFIGTVIALAVVVAIAGLTTLACFGAFRLIAEAMVG